MKVIVWHDHITRQLLREHPNDVWLFGDNLLHVGLGGMAKEMRGEPNAIGIPTKVKPTMDEDAFFHDTDYDWVVDLLDGILYVVKRVAIERSGNIIVPYGIGMGLAKLQEKAPKIYKALKDKLAAL